MATLVLTAVGTLVGGPIGGAIGAVLGQSVDAMLFAPKARQGPRLGDLSVQTSSYGTPIPKLFGRMRVAGTVIWSTDLIERRSTSGGGKGRPQTVDYSYSASFAVALSARPVREVRRIWADGKLLRGADGGFKVKTRFRLHAGDEDQEVDPLIAAAEGSGGAGAPAFRGVAYAMFEELELAEFGNRIPSLTFEVVADAGPVAIGEVAAELAGGVRAGGGSSAVTGYAASGDSVRGAIEDLAELAGLGLVDDGARLVLQGLEGQPAMLSRERESGRRELVRRPAASVPGEVTLTYYDDARDYQAGLQRAAAGPPGGAAERRGLAAVLDASAAKALAERRLEALWAGRVSATLTCGWGAAGVRPGALVRIEGEAGRWRVRRWTLGDMRVKLELVRAGGEAAPAAAASAGRPVSEGDRPHGPTVLRLIDLPLAELSGDGAVLAVMAAGAEAGWRRADLSVSFDGGASWQDIGTSAAPAVLGRAVTALAPAGSALFDRAGTVEVELLHDEMELQARSDAALIAGANLALIGGELVQFGSAERLGSRRYRLGRLLRGRRGTEWAASSHVAGEDFALIEAASIRVVELPPGLEGGAAVRMLASGVADETPAETDIAASGEALRPPSPVHVRAIPVAGGTEIEWVRRSRQGWSWASGSDTPLGEESELYRLTISGAGWVREVEVAQSRFFYAAATRAADGPGPATLSVVQLGTRGPSRPGAIIIS